MGNKYQLGHKISMNKIVSVIFFIICICACLSQISLAKQTAPRKSLDARQNNYIEIQTLNFNTKELEKIETIRTMEYAALRPIALSLESYLLREDELNKTKCKWYQKQCKKELKKNKIFIAGDIKELKRQIWQKKEYYKILYINETTRAQHLMLREMIKDITNNKTQLW